MSVINTNYLSLVAQNNLQKSQSALGTAIERLSSGLRINSAKDDAAGQAIANRMTSQITGLNQAQRNANDGISVAQTAEGALNQINDNLQRIRELTVQAANGTNSGLDLGSIQDEIGQRLKEIDRISAETNFNGVRVLSQDKELTIQVGANDDEKITVGLQKIDSSTLGLSDFNVNGVVGSAAAASAGDFGFTSATVYVTASGGSSSFSALLSAAMAALSGSFPSGFSASSLVVDTKGNVFIKGTEGSASAYLTATVTAKKNEDGEVTGFNISTGSQIITEARSESPLAMLDKALNKVDSLRSELGAVQNRFSDAINNLRTNSTNLQAARSRIEDADYAVEVANMTKNQILQQAGTSVLAQANQIPQGVLSLLR